MAGRSVVAVALLFLSCVGVGVWGAVNIPPGCNSCDELGLSVTLTGDEAPADVSPDGLSFEFEVVETITASGCGGDETSSTHSYTLTWCDDNLDLQTSTSVVIEHSDGTTEVCVAWSNVITLVAPPVPDDYYTSEPERSGIDIFYGPVYGAKDTTVTEKTVYFPYPSYQSKDDVLGHYAGRADTDEDTRFQYNKSECDIDESPVDDTSWTTEGAVVMVEVTGPAHYEVTAEWLDDDFLPGDTGGTSHPATNDGCFSVATTATLIDVSLPEMDYVACDTTFSLTATVTPSDVTGTYSWSTPTSPDHGVRFLVGEPPVEVTSAETTTNTIVVLVVAPTPRPLVTSSTVTVQFSAVDDRPATVTVTTSTQFVIVDVDLTIHRPPVLDSSEAAIPDDDEETSGSVTFVNLDNDDGDNLFDYQDDEVRGGSVSGDDELVKLTVSIRPGDLTAGSLTLSAASGGSIEGWREAAKVSKFSLGSALDPATDLVASGDSRTTTTYLEGLAPDTVACATRLTATYAVGGATATDKVCLTVVGVESVRWRGQGNSVNDDNTFDADPNANGTSSVRVVPGARYPTTTTARNEVNVDVTVSVAPPLDVSIYLRAFDVDDPTTNGAPLDNEVSSTDNRGGAGSFVGPSSLAFGPSQSSTTTSSVFRVSMSPGDNHKIVANGDVDFVNQLVNNDIETSLSVADGQKIWDGSMTVTPVGGKEVREPGKYTTTQTLTVWRRLHMEIDSMEAVHTAGAQRNFADGNIIGIQGTSTLATTVTVSGSAYFFRASLPSGPDGSTNLSPLYGGGNGRFENGTIQIGDATTSPVDGNGTNIVQRLSGFNIPFSISGGGASGGVVSLSGVTFGLNVVSGALSTNDAGATLTVAGVDMKINTVNVANSQVTVVSLTPVPYTLWDDDDQTLLPGTPDASLMDTVYAAVYMLPVDDGGGSTANNSANNGRYLAFRQNSSSYRNTTDLAPIDSAGDESDAFWVIYICSCYQPFDVRDNDPQEEGSAEGVTFGRYPGDFSNAAVARGTQGSWGFEETISDLIRTGEDANYSEAMMIVHEAGHQLGLDHELFLMDADGRQAQTRTDFSGNHQDLLRRRVRSPGN